MKMAVTAEGQSPESQDITVRIAQGRVLSPAVFSCFTNDLPSIRSEVRMFTEYPLHSSSLLFSFCLFNLGQFLTLIQHPRQRCPACTVTCSDCGKKGHFARVWRGRPKAQKSKTYQARPVDSQARRPRNVAACLPGTPPSDASSASCDSWGPPSWPPAPTPTDTCDRWGWSSWSPSLTQPDTCKPPFCDPDASDHTGYPQLGTVTLDQSQPKHLKSSLMVIRVNGHETPCLFDSGSTESFVHPDTEVHLRGLASIVADDSGICPSPEAYEEP
ncbi:uncharacterized protein LOC119963179 [Scyliorhinus canicula]|uniref:uncharacterized protein LOC119963179 n=1 Tax=Scyliorhinus canicula TaxID=7830 RepID=UPI0018F7CB1E|nr:uncharacterized protein LOC119963179 [Scyliorhinus canicula]